LTWECIYLG